MDLRDVHILVKWRERAARAGKLLFPMLPLERRSSNVKRFGTFEVDVRARELRKGGIRIRLQDQPFEILAVMLDRPGEVVTREELRQRLWPAGTFVDFEHSLNAAIKRLRAALGDDADNPRFVETLHRRGYRFIAAVESEGQPVQQSARRAAAAAKPAADSVNVRLVVLPFANLSNDPTQEYFSDGLTEEMITQIGRLCPGRLGVIARTSSMLFKRSAKSASEIGRELSADYLLEGSVRGDGDRIRITAQLIETRTEVHLWAETYDRSLGETLNLQTDVAAHIARSLAMELVPDQVDVLGRATPRRTEAYQAYLKGRYHWNRGSFEGARSAISYYERALDLDPDFAAAHSAMARARISLANHSKEPGRDLRSNRRRRRHSGRSRSIREFPTRISPWRKSGAPSNGTGARPKTNIEPRSHCRRAANRRTASTRSFSRRCRALAKRKPRPTARATWIRSVWS